MPEITLQEAKEFLDNITSEDRVAIIHHDDGDGFCSGILYYDYAKSKGAETKQFVFSFGKWDNQTNLETFDKIIITDVAPDGLIEINLPTGKEILYTDHHPKETSIPSAVAITTFLSPVVLLTPAASPILTFSNPVVL